MRQAPEIEASLWLNTDHPLSLAELKGKVVLLYAFQMLCPGCVHHLTPRVEKVHQKFAGSKDLQVIGFHTVFEHHEVMTPEALKAYVHENKLSFPIGVDTHSPGKRIPKTMSAYDMQGTPTLILIDRQGILRTKTFGLIDDLDLGLALGKMLEEKN